MNKIILSVAIAFAIVGCGTSTSSRTTESIPAEQVGSGTTTITAGGDVTINETVVTGNGMYIYNPGSGDVTYVAGDYMQYADERTGETGSGASIEGMSETTCKDAGYFWCTLDNVCIDNGGSGGTGSCTKSG